MYEITAKHLKKCFPNIKLGGPALASRLYWLEDFLYEMEKRQAPLDFISWHSYCKGPQRMLEKAAAVNELLHKYHFDHVERILNEWNYIKGWANEEFIYSIKSIHGIKGATFILSCMSEVQRTDLVDMLMYYDVTPSIWNSLFDFYTFEKLKGYYSFLWSGMLCNSKYAINVENNIENIYSLCGIDENDKILSVITYYSDDDTLENKKVSVDFGRKGKYEIYLLDDAHDAEFIGVTDTLEFDMKLHSAILIKEIEE